MARHRQHAELQDDIAAQILQIDEACSRVENDRNSSLSDRCALLVRLPGLFVSFAVVVASLIQASGSGAGSADGAFTSSGTGGGLPATAGASFPGPRVAPSPDAGAPPPVLPPTLVLSPNRRAS
jgi:hypothetical protein